MNTKDIEARAEAATPGPWTHRRQGYGDKERSKVQGECEDLAIIAVTLFEEQQRANGEFIAHAREDIPYLLAQLKAREETLAAARELASEAVCPGCLQQMDEACVDDECNWGRQLLRILEGSV